MMHQSWGVLTHEEIVACMQRRTANRLYFEPLLDISAISDTTVDIRLGQYFTVQKASILSAFDIHDFVDSNRRDTMTQDGYATYRVSYGDFFALHPGQIARVTSLEYLGLPNDVSGDVTLRHSASSIPLTATSVKIQPGYKGVIVLTLENHSARTVNLYPGIRIAHLELHWLSKPIHAPRISRFTATTLPTSMQLYKDAEIGAFRSAPEGLVVIGITSTVGAGRTTVVNHLRERHGFPVFSLSDELKERATAKGLSTYRREYLQDLGNQLRKNYGGAYLAQRLLNSEKWSRIKVPFAIVDGFKHLDEVKEFRKRTDFYLLGIDALVETRKARVLSMRRIGDPSSEESFSRIDEADRGNLSSLSGVGQQVDRVLEDADRVIMNDKMVKDLLRQVEEVVWQLRDRDRILPE